jgi:hypothetical protein
MPEDKRFVYVLKSADPKPHFYVGRTSDVDVVHRFRQTQSTISLRAQLIRESMRHRWRLKVAAHGAMRRLSGCWL